MTLKTRKPSGRAPWPTILLAGMQKSGKTWSAIEFSASPLIGRTFFIEIGETSGDQYGAVPNADFEIVDHNGSYSDILQAVKDAAAEPIVDGKPNCIILDSASRLWELLSDEAQVMANRRERAKAEKFKRSFNADADYTVGPDLWNRAKDRWYAILDILMAYAGPVIVTARFEESMVVDAQGQPTKDRAWKIKAQKSLPFEVDAIVEIRSRGDYQLTGVRSTVLQLPEGRSLPMPKFTVANLIERLGVTAENAGSRGHVALNPSATEQPATAAQAEKPPPVPLPDDYDLQVQNAEMKLDFTTLGKLGQQAAASGNQIAVAAATAAWKRAKAEEAANAKASEQVAS